MRESTIFLVEEHDDTRHLFKKLLNNNGYKVTLAINEADALEKVGDGLSKADVMLVDLVRTATTEILKAGQRIREKGNLNVPVIVIAAEYKDELQGTTVEVGENEYVVYLDGGEELFDLLSRLT